MSACVQSVRATDRRNRKLAILLAATASAVLAGATPGQVTTWIGPADGSWSVGGNWSNGVPNSGAMTALVDNGNAQNTNAIVNSSFTVGTVNISAGDQVTINNNVTLAVTTLLNNLGTVTIAAGVNSTSLSTGGGSLLLNGGGVIVMGGANAVIGNTGTLTNANNTIQGQGAIAGNGMFFINQGTVNANVSGGNIFVDPVASGMTNSGTLTSSNGGLLRLTGAFGGGMTNTGTISAQNGSVTQFENNFGVSGGTFTTSGTGVIQTAASNTANYAGISNLGNWTLANGSTSNYSGDLFNSGSINFAGAANDVTLNFNSGITNLTGGGTINMGSTGAGEANLGNGNGRLVNVNNLIRGAGRLGNNNQRFTNGAAGVVQADVSGVRLLIDPVNEADSFVNNGIMRATSGGLLQLTGQFAGGITNNGTILAQTGSAVQLISSINVTGGTFASSGTGVVEVVPGQTGSIANTTNIGAFNVQNNATLNASGTLVNNGQVSLNPVANNSLFNANAPLVITGTGTFNLNAGTNGGAFFGASGTSIEIGAGQTIRGTGNIANNNTSIINGGTINADVNGQVLFVDPPNLVGGFVNNAVMTATNGGLLQLTGQFAGGITNNGTILAQTGSAVQLISSISVTGGTFASSGTGAVEVAPGQTGIIANTTNIGTFNVQNNATLNASGTLVNNGQVSLNPVANNSLFNANAPLVITGTGTFNLNAGTNGLAFFGASGTSIEIGAGQTIRGTGNIANNNTRIVNGGTINADASGQVLFVDPPNLVDGLVNNAVMTATNGGFLRLSGQFGGDITNNGTISAQTGSRVQLVSTITIRGGTFTSSGTGGVDVAQANSGIIANAANLGVMNVFTSANLSAGGTLLNNGTINLSPGTGNAGFSNNTGTLVISGTGVFNLNPGADPGTAFFGISGGPIELGTGQVVRGRGFVGNNTVTIVNRGTIVASGGGEVFVDPPNLVDGLVNLGTMRAEAGSQLQLTGQFGGGINNAGGHIDIDPGGTLLTNNSHPLSGGTITLDGVWNAINSSNSSVVSFRGDGTLNISSSARVGLLAGGGTLGTSRVTGLSITNSGRLDLNDHDMAIDYTGPSVVASLRPLLAAGFGAGSWNGNTTMITTSAGAAAAASPDKTGIGYAEATDVLGPAPTLFRGVPVDATTAVLRYTLLGDANLDGSVNIADFSRLGANFNSAGLWFDGDFNYDGQINIGDFSLLASNFNKSLPADAMSGRGGAVPEPATLGAALVGAMLLVRRRRT